MKRLSIIFSVIAFVLSGNLALADQQEDIIHVGGRVNKPGPYFRIENESLAALINRVGGIPAFSDELKRYELGEQVVYIRINLYRDGEKRVLKIDPKSDELWRFKIKRNDVVEVVRILPSAEYEYPATITLKNPVVEPQR